MKKIMFLMMIAIAISQVVFGQKVTVSPIMPVVSLHGSYTIEQLKDFVLSDRPIVKDWVNDFVVSCFEDLMEEDIFLSDTLEVNKKALLIIKEYCYLDTVDLNVGFQNSGKDKTGKNNNIIYFTDKRNLKETVVLKLKYRSIDKIKIKMNCFNLLGGEPKGLDLTPKGKELGGKPEPEPGIQDDEWSELGEEPECVLESFVATPDTIKKGQKSILSWRVKDAAYIRISGIDANLKLMGNVEVHPLFKGRQKSAMYTMDVFKHDILSNEYVLCKTEMVYVFRKPAGPWVFKKIPNWAEVIGGALILYCMEEAGRRWVIPAIFPKNVAEFYPVDANPQMRLQKLGFTASFRL